MQNDSESPRGLNILCIDGGGVRGLSSLIILQEIMHRVESANSKKLHPHEYFDIIAGTGTGGISACMLGRLKMPIENAVEEYAKLVKAVFTEKKRSGPTIYKRTKLEEALKTIIRDATGDEKERMNDQDDNTCKTIVFAMAKHNLNAGLPTLFRSYTSITNLSPHCTIREALYATMAQPELFKSIDIVISSVPQTFVGGELGCSNPLVHVLNEVKRIHPERPISCIISIGAGQARTIQVPSPSRLGWTRTQDVIVTKDMATDSERVAEEMILRFQGTSGVYFRFNVDQGMQNMKDGCWERLAEAMQHTNAYLQKNETHQKLEEAVRSSMERRSTITTTQAAGQICLGSETAKSLSKFKRCPAPTMFYTGRHDENAQVIKCITGGQEERRVCVVYGLGGVGKTQLVLNVIERTRDEWDYIIYVDASSAEMIERALREFGTTKSIGQDYKDAINWLESCRERWLLVFDNADNASIHLEQYIPARGQYGTVLVTTRLPDLARLARGPGSACNLSNMNQTDGIALLLKLVSSGPGYQCIPDDDESAARELVKDFGYLALAIVHAGAYIAHSPGMTISKYRSLFLSERQRMLDEYNNLPVVAKLDERGDTVYTTWKMCYDQLKPESRELLRLVSYLHYDNIFEDIFYRAAKTMHSREYTLPPTDLESQARSQVKQFLSTFLTPTKDWDTVKFIGVLADLRSYSLIDFDRMNLTFRIHVLVHDWAKTVIPNIPEIAVECTTMLLSLSIDQEQDAESLAFKRRLGPHVTSVLLRNPNTGANYGSFFGAVYSLTGQWIQREKLLKQQLATFKSDLGDDNVHTWSVVDELALTYWELGQWDEALRLQTQVVDAYKRLRGEEHPLTLASMNGLVLTYSRLGRYNEAEKLGVQVLDARKRILGDEDADTLNSMNSLASIYSKQGRHDEARQLKVQVFDARKRLLGHDHPHTLDSMSNLAATYVDLGYYVEAKKLEAEVLNARKRVLGGEHPDTLTSMNNLASIYLALEQYIEAKPLVIQVLDARKRMLGEEHPDTLNSMGNLASVYLGLGQYNEAERLAFHAFNAHKRLLGEEHPRTLRSMGDLALIYSYLNRHNEAEQLAIEALSRHKQLLGEEHPDTLNSMNNLAFIYTRMERWGEAEELYRQVISVAARKLGNQHPKTQTYRNNLKDMQARRARSRAKRHASSERNAN